MAQALFDAVRTGNLDEVRRLVAATPALSAARDANGVSAVLFAAYHGRRDIAVALVAMGAPVDIFEASALGLVHRIGALIAEDHTQVSAYAQDGFYPLGLACFFGHLDAVRTLIASGADVHATARNPFKVQPVHAAAASRNLDVLRAVLEADANPNVPQQQGFVPPHDGRQGQPRDGGAIGQAWRRSSAAERGWKEQHRPGPRPRPSRAGGMATGMIGMIGARPPNSPFPEDG